MEKPGHLIVCAECGIQVGTGHVMRCLALAQAWRRAGGDVTFLMREGLAAIEERIRAEGVLLQTLPGEGGGSPEDFDRAAIDAGCPIAVLDGYSFGASEQATLSGAGIRVLTIDDYGHASDYPVRWVLNQNAYATPEMYGRTNHNSKLLLGPAYALLRDEFSPWIGWKRAIPDRARKILITIGGSDPDNASEQILQSLALLKSSPEDSPGDSEAIAGAGVTSYELCYMGLPSMLLIVAENQRRTAERLSELGMAVNAGTSREFRAGWFAGELRALMESSERRAAMSGCARELVDGLGSERVRAALIDRGLKLRSVRENDCQLLFEWAQDPVVRAASFHSAAISWEEHSHWFAERMQDPQSVIYIGENAAGEPVGVVRFQIKGESAVLSVNVALRFRGEGWGRELILFSTRDLVRANSAQRVDAFVKPENQASVRLFEASGFQRKEKERIAGQDALLFTWECRTGTHAG